MSEIILVADDDAAVRMMVEEALTSEGFSVVTAQDGADCVAKVAAHLPDLVILDLNMPETGGIEALRNLRSDPQTRQLPVIILTGQPEFSTMVEGWTAGANQYLRKPVSKQLLLKEIRRLLATSTGENAAG